MEIAQFKEDLETIADELSEKTPLIRHVYSRVIIILLEFISVRGIAISEEGVLKLEKKDVILLFDKVYVNRSYQARQRCNCLNLLLDALRFRKRYEGFFLNIPQHIPRKLVFDLSSIPFADLKIVGSLENYLALSESNFHNGRTRRYTRRVANPSAASERMALRRIETEFLCSFLSSAILSGALSLKFIERILNVKFSELTFIPFTMRCFDSDEDIREREGDGLSFFRIWLPPVVELYFFRLVLFLHKQQRVLALEFDDNYVFPRSYRTVIFRKRLQSSIKPWVMSALSGNPECEKGINIKDLRHLSAYKFSDKVPCFLLSAMINKPPCDSFEKEDLQSLYDGLDTATEVVAPSCNDGTLERPNCASSGRVAIKALIRDRAAELQKIEIFKTLLNKIHRIRYDLPLTAVKEKLEAAEKIERAVSDTFKDDGEQIGPALINLRCYALWLALRLRIPKMPVKTIHTSADPIESRFLYVLYDKALPMMNTEELISAIIQTYEAYYADDIRSHLKTFTDDLFYHQDDIFPKMNWSRPSWDTDRRLSKPIVKIPKPLITFEQVRDLLQLATNQMAEPERGKMRVAIILGFFAGLRISEVLYLKKQSLIYDDGYVICIKRSKTKAGERNVPLSLLLPDIYLQEVVSFFRDVKAESSQVGSGIGRPDYVMLEEEIPYKEVKDFSRIINKLVEDINPEATFHHLRHAFINWFLIRWYVALYGSGHSMMSRADFLKKEDVFSKTALDNLKTIVFGYGKQKTHQMLFSHVIAVLSRLVGHAGPVTTMTNYIHISDWLGNLFMNDGATVNDITVNITEIKNFLQLTYIPKSILPKLSRNKSTTACSIAPDSVIKEQLKLLHKMLLRETYQGAP